MDSRPLLLAVLFLTAAGCRDGAAGDRISRERFVAANVALRTLPAEATDAQRAAVLERYGVTAVDLHRWVDAHAERPEALAAAWQQVAARLDSLAASVDLPPEDELPPPPPGPIVEEPVPGVVKEEPHLLPEPPRALEIHPRERRERRPRVRAEAESGRPEPIEAVEVQ